MAVLGQTFDCYKKLDYLFDLVFEITKKGKSREALVKKTRIESFAECERFPFSYDEIANRYGRDILEKNSQLLLATAKQIQEAISLVTALEIKQEVINKWFKKGEASNWDEMTQPVMDSIISFLKSKATKLQTNSTQENSNESV